MPYNPVGFGTPHAAAGGSGGGSGYQPVDTSQFKVSYKPASQPKQVFKAQPKQQSGIQKVGNFFKSTGSFLNRNVVQPTVTTGEKTLNTAEAGQAGLFGGAKVAGQLLTGNKKGAEQTAANSTRVINQKLSKGAGGKGGYISPTQAATRGGGIKAVKQNVKSVVQGASDIAPLVVPFGKAAEGASLLSKVGQGAVKNAAVGGASALANEAVSGNLRSKQGAKQTLEGVLQGAALGAGGELLHAGVKTGREAADTSGAKVALQKAKQDALLAQAEKVRGQQAVERAKQPVDLRTPEEKQAAAKEAQQTQDKIQKVDRQTELLQAKQKDNSGELSNVDKTKLQHLRQDKAQLTGTEVPSIKAFGKTIQMTPENGFKETKTADGGSVYQKTSMRGNNARGDRQAIIHYYTSDGKNITKEQHDAMVNGGMPYSEQTANTKPVQNREPAVSNAVEPKTLTPTQTAHMPEIGGYTHSTHLLKDYADMLRGQEKEAKGGYLIDQTGQNEAYGSGVKRVSEHSKFYRDFHKENGKPPKVSDYVDEARRQLESGHAYGGASEDYKALLEREAKPIPRMEINTTPIKGSGKILKSKVGVGVEARAVSNKLTKSLGDLPEYSKVDMKQQGMDAAHLLQNDEQKAIDIALGKTPPPAHLLPESVYTAVEAKAIATGDVELLKALAHSSRVGEATVMGQRIRALGERIPNSPTAAIRKLSDDRKQAFEKRTGKTADKAVNEEVKKYQTTKPKVTRETWGSFIDGLKC